MDNLRNRIYRDLESTAYNYAKKTAYAAITKRTFAPPTAKTVAYLNSYKNRRQRINAKVMPKYKRKSVGYARRTKRFKKGINRTSGRWNAPGALGGDMKNLDLYSNTTSIGPTTRSSMKWKVDDVNGTQGSMVEQIIVGSGFNQRSRQKIVIQSVQITGHIGTPTGEDNSGWVKLSLVLDKQANGALGTYPMVFTDETSADRVTELRNMENTQRFDVLKDLYVYIPKYLTGTKSSKIINFYHKCRIPIEYKIGSGGAMADVRSNNLILLYNADVTWYPILTARLRYTTN